jgi:excisionase family DNA binding protein
VTEPLLRLPDVAAELAVSLSTVKRLVRSGELPVVRVGVSVRVRRDDLRRFVAARIERRSTAMSSSPAGVSLGRGERLWD